MSLSKTLKDKITLQSSLEYEHALKYRQKREADWRTIDDLYYGKRKKSLIARAQVHVPKMQGTIETFISKVDDDIYIHFEGQEEGDRPKALRLNALIRRDMNIGDWDLKDIVAKKEAALYGRTQFKKYSTNVNGFTDHLDVVDCLDFLIDPLAGGLTPIENAYYLGQDNIIRSKAELLHEKNNGVYDKQVVNELAKPILNDAGADNRYHSKEHYRQSLNLSQAVLVSDDSIRLVEWYTTYGGKRYYCLFDPQAKKAIRCEKLVDVFGNDEWPFATWAPFPRLTEYWTPGLGELIKEPNIVQNILLGQMLDNTAYRNYGMKAYDTGKIVNPAELIPRPMGKIAVNGNPNEAIKDITFPDITPSLQMYNSLENIYDKETGVSPQAKGMPNSKRMSATEFAGLLDEVADRFSTSNKTYKHALRRLAKLYKDGVEENMTSAQRVRILGARGFEWQKVTNEDVTADFDVLVSTGAQDEANKGIERDRFQAYIKGARENQRLNQRFLDEKEARIMGFEEDEIQRLMNPEIEGDWEILAEAAQENEELLTKQVPPNRSANAGHIQKHLDFMRDTSDLSPEQVARIMSHARAEIEPAIRNEELRASKFIQEKQRLEDKQELGQAPKLPAASPAIPGQAPSIPVMPGMTPTMPPAPSYPEQVRFDAIRNAPPAAAIGP